MNCAPRWMGRLVSRWSLCVALSALAGSALQAATPVPGVLDRGGDPAFVGAYLLNGPAESAKPAATLERGTRVMVHEDELVDGYYRVDRVDGSGKVIKSGWVHRKFLSLGGKPAAAAVSAPEPVAAKPVAPKPESPTAASGDNTITQLRQRIEALEAKNAELHRRVGDLEKTGLIDPTADFIQRLQKLEMEVRSRDNASLPTVPFPEVQPSGGEAPKSEPPPARIPAMSWILRGW